MPAKVTRTEDATTRVAATTSNFIRAWRLYRGYESQAALSAKVPDLNASVLSRLESGSLQYRQWHIDLLADALNVSPRDLIGRDPNAVADVFSIYEGLNANKRKRALKLMRALAQ